MTTIDLSAARRQRLIEHLEALIDAQGLELRLQAAGQPGCWERMHELHAQLARTAQALAVAAA